jgi:hypothetical protein
MSDFKNTAVIDVLDNMYVLRVDNAGDVPFPFKDDITQADAMQSIQDYIKDNSIDVTNKDQFEFLNKVQAVNEEQEDYVKMVYEMSTYDLKTRNALTSFEDFSKVFDNVSKVIKFDKNNDPIAKHKLKAKRHELFMHEIFGNNYRMFGLEGPFDINDIK